MRPKRSADVIQRINARGVTVLLIEHDMGLVMRIAQRIAVLDFGRKIAEGTPDEIKPHPDVIAAYLGGVEAERCLSVDRNSLQSLVNGVGIGLVYGLIGIGFCVIYNASGIVNFAQGVFVMLGGMVCHTLLAQLGLPLWLAAIITVPMVACVGVLMQVADRPAHVEPRRRHVRHHPGDAGGAIADRADRDPDARRPAAHLPTSSPMAGR